jgi:hypothetical protein
MSHHAPIPAAKPHLSLSALRGTSTSLDERNGGGKMPSFRRTLASRMGLQFGRTSATEKRTSDFDPTGFIRLVSRPLLGVTLRGYPAPCGSALFCFDFVALRVTVSIRDGPSVNAELGTWEPGPLARLRQV